MIAGLKNTVRAVNQGAIAALAGLLLSTASAPAADLADLGGSCCADLEERIAELEATTARKGNRRVTLTISGHVNRSLLYWDDSFQADLYSVDNAISNSRFRFTGNANITADLTAGFYVGFNLARGARSHQVSQVDDDGFPVSGGEFGASVFGDGLGGAGDSTIGWDQAYWYLSSKQYGRFTLGRLTAATAGIATIDLSNTGVIANSQPFLWGGGMIMRSGQGTLAATGLLPGETGTVSSTLAWGQMCGGPTTGVSGLQVVETFGGAGPYAVDCGIHALNRRDAVMYTSPTWWGFTFGGTYGEDDFWDVAGRYAGEWYGFRVAAGVGYRWYLDREPDIPVPGPAPVFPFDRASDTDRRHWLTSASVMHIATGLFASAAWTQYQYRGTSSDEIFGFNLADNRPNTDLFWVDGGIQKNWTGLGNTTLYAEYGKVWDGITGRTSIPADALGGFRGTSGLFPLGANGVVADSDMEWWGAGAVQTINAAAMDIYLGFRYYTADTRMGDVTLPDGSTVDAVQIPGGFEDIWYIQGGARIQF